MMSVVGRNQPSEKHRPNDRSLIRKQPFRMAPMNGRLWPKAAVALKPSQMTARGHFPP